MSYINYTLHDQPYVKAVELDQYVVSAVNGYTSVADYNQRKISEFISSVECKKQNTLYGYMAILLWDIWLFGSRLFGYCLIGNR